MAKRGRPTDYRIEFSDECDPDPNTGQRKDSKLCRHVICHMAEGKSKESYAGKIGSHIDSIYAWAEEHGEFSEAIKRGTALSLLWWENGLQAGTMGQLRAVTAEEYGKDGRVVKRKFKSAQFHVVGAIFTMKNRFPKLYKDRIDLRHSGDPSDKDGLADMTMDELQAEADRLTNEIKRARKK